MTLEEENLFKVALTTDDQVIIHYYRGHDMTPDLALNLAAWLSSLALSAGGDFEKYVDLCERIQEAEINRKEAHGNKQTPDA